MHRARGHRCGHCYPQRLRPGRRAHPLGPQATGRFPVPRRCHTHPDRRCDSRPRIRLVLDPGEGSRGLDRYGNASTTNPAQSPPPTPSRSAERDPIPPFRRDRHRAFRTPIRPGRRHQRAVHGFDWHPGARHPHRPRDLGSAASHRHRCATRARSDSTRRARPRNRRDRLARWDPSYPHPPHARDHRAQSRVLRGRRRCHRPPPKSCSRDSQPLRTRAPPVPPVPGQESPNVCRWKATDRVHRIRPNRSDRVPRAGSLRCTRGPSNGAPSRPSPKPFRPGEPKRSRVRPFPLTIEGPGFCGLSGFAVLRPRRCPKGPPRANQSLLLSS